MQDYLVPNVSSCSTATQLGIYLYSAVNHDSSSSPDHIDEDGNECRLLPLHMSLLDVQLTPLVPSCCAIMFCPKTPFDLVRTFVADSDRNNGENSRDHDNDDSRDDDNRSDDDGSCYNRNYSM